MPLADPPRPDVHYQRAADVADEAGTAVLAALSNEASLPPEGLVAGMIAAAVRHYVVTSGTDPGELFPRAVFTALTPVVQGVVHHVVDAIRAERGLGPTA